MVSIDRRRACDAESQFDVPPDCRQQRIAGNEHERGVRERLGARRCTATVEDAGLVDGVENKPLSERLRLAVGRQQRIDELPFADEPEERPAFAFIKDGLTVLVPAFRRNGGDLMRRFRPCVGERGAVGEKRFDVGALVDPLEPNRPPAGAEIARVPRKASRAKLREFVSQCPWVALVRELENTANRQTVERVENMRGALRRREGACVQRDGRRLGHRGHAELYTRCAPISRGGLPGFLCSGALAASRRAAAKKNEWTVQTPERRRSRREGKRPG